MRRTDGLLRRTSPQNAKTLYCPLLLGCHNVEPSGVLTRESELLNSTHLLYIYFYFIAEDI